MISDLLAEAVLVAAVALVTMPLVVRRFARAFRPVELTRYNSTTMGAGMALVLTALVVCAVPVVSAVVGADLIDRHFFPGDAVIGWISALIALALVAVGIVGRRRSLEIERRLMVEPTVGVHVVRPEFELVILPAERPMAYAVAGDHPQVVLTTGLMATLTVTELVSVVEHETAHIRLGHRRHLAIISLLDPLASWIRPIQRLLEVARMALERAADAATTDRSATRSALLRLSGVSSAPGIAAFTAGDVVERVEALAMPTSPHGGIIRTLLYAVAGCLGVASLIALLLFLF